MDEEAVIIDMTEPTKVRLARELVAAGHISLSTVLICGSRTWDRWAPIRTYIGGLPLGTVIVEGEARGADSIARDCAKQLGYEVRPYPADWDIHDDCSCYPKAKYCRLAGFRRNQQMLDEEEIDRVVAFTHDLAKSSGTRDMVERARKAGIPVEVLP